MDGSIVQLTQIIQDHEARIAKLESLVNHQSAPEPSTKSVKPLSLREFLRERKPVTDVQRTLAIAYYLEHYERVDRFNADDLEAAFRKAKEPLPSNTHAFINLNIRKGHMMEAEEKKDKLKAFVVTNSGEEFVANGFADREK